MDIDQTARSDAFKRGDATSYDAVADDFERLAQRFTRPIATRILDLAGIDKRSRLLDVGCGTGILARLAATRVGEGGQLIGLDLSEGALQKARELAAEEGLAGRIEFRKGDAEQLEFPDGSFDVVVSLYALRHLPDPVRSFREMLRVLAPEGRAVVAVGSAPPFGSLAFFTAGGRFVLERLQIALGRGPLYATAFLDGLLDGHLGHASREEEAEWTHGIDQFSGSVSSMMRKAGFARVRTHWVGQTSYIESAAAFWTLQATLSSPARKRIAAASEDKVVRLRQAFDDICARHLARGGTLIYRSAALIVVGERLPAYYKAPPAPRVTRP